MFCKEWLLNTDKNTNIDKTPNNDQMITNSASVQSKTLEHLDPKNPQVNYTEKSNFKNKSQAKYEHKKTQQNTS